jgi:signal transduction histidine kinase
MMNNGGLGRLAPEVDMERLAEAVNGVLNAHDIFRCRLGAGLPLVFLLAQFGFFVFWFVYPLSEIVTLLVLCAYYRSRGEHHRIASARVYTAAFQLEEEAVTGQLDAAAAFAAKWGGSEEKRYLLRLALEEICSALEGEQRGYPLRLQITLLAREDGTFELHLRDNGEKFDPFQLARAALARKPEGLADLSQDSRGLSLHLVKSHASNLFYRTSQGFNTLTLSI